MRSDFGLRSQVAPKALELERRIFEGIGAEEIEAFRAMLDRLEAATAALER